MRGANRVSGLRASRPDDRALLGRLLLAGRDDGLAVLVVLASQRLAGENGRPDRRGSGRAGPGPVSYGRAVTEDRPYLRFPAVSGDSICFVADDDLFLAPLAGGTARRLTSDRAPSRLPRISPAGTEIAYTSQRDGVAEVFVVRTDGSELRRLTYLGDPTTRTIGWSEDGRVLAISAVGQPFGSRTWAYAISLEGGEPERLPYGPVTAIARAATGAVVLGVNQSSHRGAAWKRYRGGTAGALWIDREGRGSFEPFLRQLNGQLEDPFFVGERLCFVSDHEGVANIYSVLPDGSDLERHSDHADFYARAASSDGTTVVYQCAGDLYRLDGLTADSQPSRIDISLGAPRSGRAARRLQPAASLGEYAADRTGRASAVEVRGEIHHLTHRKGPARLLTGGAGVRARLPEVAGPEGTQAVLAITDAEGEDGLELIPLDQGGEARRYGVGELGRVLELAGSPDGRWAAVATHDGRVVLVELAGGGLKTLAACERGDASGLSFSPDSRYLVWSEPGPAPLRHIVLASVEDGRLVEVTPLRFHDYDPVFSLDGKYLAFLSVRTFDPMYDVHVFDMAFGAGARPHLVPLGATTPSPFSPEVGGRPRTPPAGGQEAGGDGAGKDAESPPVPLEEEGLAGRITPFPVAAGRYSDLQATKDGFSFLSHPLVGVLGEERAELSAEPKRPSLVHYDLEKAKQIELVSALDSFSVSGDGLSMVVRDEKALRVLPATHKVEPADPGSEPDPNEVTEVDLERIRVELDPPLEWRQMYDEAARLMRDHYWVADMAGVAWGEIVERYRPLLDRIATRDDLSELLWEVQGELGTSHAYEMPPARPVEGERRLGLLGADLRREEDGSWRIARILPGESSVMSARSPLSAPGVGLVEGDAIVAVDGRPLEPAGGPGELLVGAAGKPVQLTVRNGGGERQVVVEPLADERPLRYQAWVADRRTATHEASGGRVGYVHIPDMMGNGWAELHRDLRVEVEREGLLIDVRDNGGGHTSELVLEKLARTVRAWETGRHLGTQTYPQHSPRGPRVLLTNENAGSDGDIVTAGFRQRQLGPVVGKRTWGGVIGIDGRYQLVDGTTVTQPRYAFWFYGFGWDVENHGVDPDIEVPIAPQDSAEGRDPQLERGVELVLAGLEAEPAATPPDPATRPSRGAPPLPPRPERT